MALYQVNNFYNLQKESNKNETYNGKLEQVPKRGRRWFNQDGGWEA